MHIASPGSVSRGFTLIEIMVVIAILAILGAIAAPSFQNLLLNNRLGAASSALQVSLSLARSEASKRGADSRVSVVANGTAGSWGNGWTVFEDKTGNANGGVAPTADSATVTRLEIVAPPAGSVSFSQTGALDYFTYNGQGRLISSTGGPANRSFWFFVSSSEKYCLVINISGRVRTERVASSASCTTE